VATIAASAWRPTQLITLGSPRVGDVDFVNSIAGVETHRIVNCCDLVTRVPPRVIYEHTPGLIFVAHDATLLQDHSASAIDLDRHLGRGDYFARHALRLGNAPARDLADHAPVNYLRAFFR
jgi:triacylglycerol lipase